MAEERWSDRAFEEFWARYPRKVGKLAAKKAWEKARVTPTVFEQIQRTLAWQLEQWDDPEFIPHPRTWISQGRWLDEPPKPRKPNGQACPHTPKCADDTACWMKTVGWRSTPAPKGESV